MPELFGYMPSGDPVFRIALDNDYIQVNVLTFGAAIQSIELPDRTGKRGNIVLSLHTLEEYIARSPHFGATPGRYAGRIGGGRFTLDGAEYRLTQNDGLNTLHGGRAGFGKRAWTLVDHGRDHVVLTLHSAEGDEGFPGAVNVKVRYALQHANLHIEYSAQSTQATVLNLTNHSYFNLAGEGSGSVLGHHLTIDADCFVPIRADSIPTGEIRPVDGTPFDFRGGRLIGDRIRDGDPQIKHACGYDHAFMLNGVGLRRAGILRDPRTGRSMTLSTTEPAVQLYTANRLDGALAGPSGRTYRQGDAVCLEAQHVADSPNQPAFPSTVLRPGKPYTATTIFGFAIDDG